MPVGAVMRRFSPGNHTRWPDVRTCEENALREYDENFLDIWRGLGWSYFLWPVLLCVLAPCVACIAPVVHKSYMRAFHRSHETTDQETEQVMKFTAVGMLTVSGSVAICFLVMPVLLFPALEPLDVVDVDREVLFCLPLGGGRRSVEIDRISFMVYLLKFLMDMRRLCSRAEDDLVVPKVCLCITCCCLPLFWLWKFALSLLNLSEMADRMAKYQSWMLVQAWNMYTVWMAIPEAWDDLEGSSVVFWLWFACALLTFLPWLEALRQFLAPETQFRRVMLLQLVFVDLAQVVATLVTFASYAVMNDFMVYAFIGASLDAALVIKRLLCEKVSAEDIGKDGALLPPSEDSEAESEHD